MKKKKPSQTLLRKHIDEGESPTRKHEEWIKVPTVKIDSYEGHHYDHILCHRRRNLVYLKFLGAPRGITGRRVREFLGENIDNLDSCRDHKRPLSETKELFKYLCEITNRKRIRIHI